MPIYDYQCENCHNESEHLHNISASVPNCPHCGQAGLQKKITAPKVRFTGSGYFETDEKPESKQRHILKKETSGQATKD